MTEPLICQLSNRGVIRIGGGDRRNFLQGLISNDINLCTPEQPIYAAFLTPQGKFLHDMFIVDSDGAFLVDCESARANDLLKRLGMHKLRAKVTLEDAPEYEVWAMWEPTELSSFLRKPESSQSIGQNLRKDTLDPDLRRGDAVFFEDPRLPALGARAIVKKGASPDGQRVDFSVYDKHRLALGVPDGSRDILVEKSTLLECNLDLLNGISWTKGCYMGQELTARMYHRALVKKRLFPVKIEGPAPALGAPVLANGEDIGEMRSSCGDLGLALLKIEKVRTNELFSCGNSTLKPVLPEWMKT